MRSDRGTGGNRSEAELLRASRAGDAEAFDHLVEAHYRSVYNTAYRMLRTPSAASDATQATFVRVWEALSSFRGDASFSTWLYRITMNVCLDELRRSKNRPLSLTVEDDDGEPAGERDMPDFSDEPSGTAEQRELQQLVHEAIGRLSDDFRAVIVLYDIRGLSYQEISEALGVPLGTVKSRLNRARQALREEMEPWVELFDR
ncbi:MAG: RNA polymerase sigma factor [Armatimonadota bacterium]